MTNKEAIYRQDVLDLAKKGILISNGSYKSVCKAINELPPVNPQPCEDAISRQAVLDLVVTNHRELNGINVVMYSPLCKDIKQLPPVTPQPKTGYWIGIDGKPSHLQDGMTTGSVWCLECGKWLTASDEYSCFGKFCPNCGAKMVEPQERSGEE